MPTPNRPVLPVILKKAVDHGGHGENQGNSVCWQAFQVHPLGYGFSAVSLCFPRVPRGLYAVFNVKLAKRARAPLSRLRERARREGKGMASFIIRGGSILAMPVRDRNNVLSFFMIILA